MLAYGLEPEGHRLAGDLGQVLHLLDHYVFINHVGEYRSENNPNVVYIYNVDCSSEEFRPRLRSVLLQSSPVISATWNPVKEFNVALCCGGCAMYTWVDSWTAGNEEEMAECVGIPTSESFQPNYGRGKLRRQSPRRLSFLVMGTFF